MLIFDLLFSERVTLVYRFIKKKVCFMRKPSSINARIAIKRAAVYTQDAKVISEREALRLLRAELSELLSSKLGSVK